jgi:hypothetical protein
MLDTCGIEADSFVMRVVSTTVEWSGISILKVSWPFSIRASSSRNSDKWRWLFLLLTMRVTECPSSEISVAIIFRRWQFLITTLYWRLQCGRKDCNSASVGIDF